MMVTLLWKNLSKGLEQAFSEPCLIIWSVLITIHGEGNDTPLQYSCLENPMDGGACWAAVHGVAKSQTRLSDFREREREEIEREREVLFWELLAYTFMEAGKSHDLMSASS